MNKTKIDYWESMVFVIMLIFIVSYSLAINNIFGIVMGFIALVLNIMALILIMRRLNYNGEKIW